MNLAPSRWSPQPGPQNDAICADWCDELFYGGAAGGGKSDFLLGDYLQDVGRYGSAWQGVIFRRTYPELEELVARSREIYPQTGAEWHEQKHRWTWPGGEVLRMRYLEREADATRYQGHQYTWIGWDELTQWPSAYAYRYLRARLRSAHKVDRKRIRGAANPGGVGHHWVKAMFIDPAPGGYVPVLDPETGMTRMFIPARLKDNTVLLASDPGYAGRLKGLGSPELVRAWLEGDWSVIQGAYFTEFSMARHVIEPRALPGHWTRFRMGDWGTASPFAFLWGAVSDGELSDIPRGAIVIYREWYGSTGEPNVGLKMDAARVAQGVAARTPKDEAITYSVLDPACFKFDGGPTIAETFALNGVTCRPADNARIAQRGAIGGWDQVRARLVGDNDGRPMLLIFNTCTHLIRTLPALQHDQDKPEDVDTDGEDHAPDALRYGCMSRPWIRTVETPAPPQWPLQQPIMDMLNRHLERRREAHDE